MASATSPISIAKPSPSSENCFDIFEFASFGPQDRRLLSESEKEQALWLAGLLEERVRANPDVIPAFPEMAVRVLRFMEAPNPDLIKLVRMIRDDAMISAQLLRTANSAFYSRGNEVNSVQDASVRLGLRTVANVAIAAATRAMLDQHEREYRDYFSEQWQHLSQYCMQSAANSRWLSMELRKGDPEQIFLAGLLHDVGKIAALRAAGMLIPDGDLSPFFSTFVVEAALEEAHVDLGASLAIKWTLPGHVIHVCTEHHQAKPGACDENTILHLVRIGSSLFETRTNPCFRPSLEDELTDSAEALGLSPKRLRELALRLKELGPAV